MQLGEIIRDFNDEASAAEAMIACGDVVLLARVDSMAGRFSESIGEYASGAVRRFANLAGSEDWLGLMNVLERTTDPGAGCLTYMVGWSLKHDEASQAPSAEKGHGHSGCTCGGSGGCS